MIYRIVSSGLFLSLLLGSGATTYAQSIDVMEPESACTDTLNTRLGYEQRLFRSVLFGARKASDLPTGSVLHDDDGDTWMKTAQNNWKSPENTGLTWSDTLVDQRRDIDVRRGILETQKALTSEFLPSILQSVRAMQCRMRAVCLVASEAQNADSNATEITVQPPGCMEFTLPMFSSCRDNPSVLFQSAACDDTVDMIIDRESRMLEMVIAYDAAYRTLLQFAGTFEGFLTDFRFPLLQPLWQMIRAVGDLDGLPCFLAECNE